jgi:hypothetical protein
MILSYAEVEHVPAPILRHAIYEQARVRGTEWVQSILRPTRKPAIASLNLQELRIIARLWCTWPPRPGVTQIEPGTVRGRIWE